MGHLAGAFENRAQGPFGGQRNAIVGGFAVDEEAAALGREVGGLRAGRVALLAAHKQQPDPESRRAQRLGGGNLGGQNALGVANAAAVKKILVLAEGNVGRHSVHVRGKNQIGSFTFCAGVDVPARAAAGVLARLLDGALFDLPAARAEKIGEKIAHRAFVVGCGLNFAQLAGKADGIKGFRLGSKRRAIGLHTVRIPQSAWVFVRNSCAPPASFEPDGAGRAGRASRQSCALTANTRRLFCDAARRACGIKKSLYSARRMMSV